MLISHLLYTYVYVLYYSEYCGILIPKRTHFEINEPHEYVYEFKVMKMGTVKDATQCCYATLWFYIFN